MAIPVQGWTLPVFGTLRNYPLPENYTIRYSDGFRFGKVSNVLLHRRGHPFVTDRSGYRLIDIQIDITSVHDVALVDRIE